MQTPKEFDEQFNIRKEIQSTATENINSADNNSAQQNKKAKVLHLFWRLINTCSYREKDVPK